MRFNFCIKCHQIRSLIVLLSAASLLITCFFLVRSYWVRDEVGLYMTHENARVGSAGGTVFWLSITNYPLAGKWFMRSYHGSPDHLWNVADVWGPTTCWYRYLISDYREPLFEYAQGSWKNFLTAEQPTPMRYTAARLPHWALATFFALVAVCAGWRRSARSKAGDSAGSFPVITEGIG